MVQERSIHPTLIVIIWIAIALLAVAVQAICASYAWPYLTNGQLLDADSYTWLGHVQRLLDTGHWFDHMQPRANWPFGELQHSSRPFDALLLAGAFILSPLFGTEKALLVAGTWSSATLYLVLCGAIGWTGTRLFSQSRGMVAAALLMSQFPVLAYSIPGRADHHTLILVVLAATIGLTASLLKNAARTRTALFAGCIAGFGL